MAVRICGKGHCGHVAGNAVTEPGIPEGLQLQVTHTGTERLGVMEESKWHGGELGRKVMPNLLFHPLPHPRAECSAGQN